VHFNPWARLKLVGVAATEFLVQQVSIRVFPDLWAAGSISKEMFNVLLREVDHMTQRNRSRGG